VPVNLAAGGYHSRDGVEKYGRLGAKVATPVDAGKGEMGNTSRHRHVWSGMKVGGIREVPLWIVRDDHEENIAHTWIFLAGPFDLTGESCWSVI
jgi:hypothetical protein